MALRNRLQSLREIHKQQGLRATFRLARNRLQTLLLIETFRTHGLREVLRVVRDGLRYFGQSRKILVALSEPRPLPKAIKASETHEFKFATPEELLRIAENPAYVISPEDIEYVSRGVARCLLQMDGEHLAGYAWIWNSRLAYLEDIEGGVHVDGVHVNLPDDTIYNYKAYTNPDYRGYGYQALRHLQLLKMTEAEGVKRLFGYVDHFNSSSLKGVRKSGYVPVGELRVRHRGGRAKMILDVQEDFWSSKMR
jgi:GNAT superfamily N-acetyltransferase